jgi:hypothetical protein
VMAVRRAPLQNAAAALSACFHPDGERLRAGAAMGSAMATSACLGKRPRVQIIDMIDPCGAMQSAPGPVLLFLIRRVW